jgi:hypothetical protein
MQTPDPRSIEQWRDWFARVSERVLMVPSLDCRMAAEFAVNAADDAALGKLQERVEAMINELDQDAVSADLLAQSLFNPTEIVATQRVSASLDRLSVSLLGLLLRLKDRRFELGNSR